jgi:hypothetical protein
LILELYDELINRLVEKYVIIFSLAFRNSHAFDFVKISDGIFLKIRL